MICDAAHFQIASGISEGFKLHIPCFLRRSLLCRFFMYFFDVTPVVLRYHCFGLCLCPDVLYNISICFSEEKTRYNILDAPGACSRCTLPVHTGFKWPVCMYGISRTGSRNTGGIRTGRLCTPAAFGLVHAGTYLTCTNRVCSRRLRQGFMY